MRQCDVIAISNVAVKYHVMAMTQLLVGWLVGWLAGWLSVLASESLSPKKYI